MLATRIRPVQHPFTAAAVVVIAMVVGGWTTSTRGGGEEAPPMSIVMSVQPGAYLIGQWCLGTVGTYNAVGDVDYLWTGAHWNASTRNVEGYVWESGSQLVEAWDEADQYAYDQKWIEVTSTGNYCYP